MSYGKKSAPAASGASTNTAKTMPVFSLSVAVEGQEGLVNLTGLFENKSKAGNKYFSGKDEDGNKFFLFPSTKEDESPYRLAVSNADSGEEGGLENIANLDAAESKKGITYFTGNASNGDRFMVFAKTPKN